jgi:hypothetical protein
MKIFPKIGGGLKYLEKSIRTALFSAKWGANPKRRFFAMPVLLPYLQNCNAYLQN